MIKQRHNQDKRHPTKTTFFSGGTTHLTTSSMKHTDSGCTRKQHAPYYLRFPLILIVPVFVLAQLLCILIGYSFLGGNYFAEPLLPSNDDSSADVEDVLTPASKFPDGWESYSYTDIRDHFDCRRRSMDNDKPLPSMESWKLMRDAFTSVKGSQKSWNDPVPPTLGYSLDKSIPYPQPYYAKLSPGKGRGLFASKDIAKGELVHDGNRSDVLFPNALVWRKYVFSLPKDLACDSTDWVWMQKLKEGGRYRLLTAINISVLMNSGGVEYGPGKDVNTLPVSSTSSQFYATKDISKGDEILTDYDLYYTKWSLVGL